MEDTKQTADNANEFADVQTGATEETAAEGTTYEFTDNDMTEGTDTQGEETQTEEAPSSPDGGADNAAKVKDPTKAYSDRLNKERARIEEEISKKYERLMKAMQSIGVQGNSPEEIAIQLEAEAAGISVDEYKRQEEQRQHELEDYVKNSPEVAEKDRLIEELESLVRRQIFREDIAKLKAVYPDLKAESVEDLGEVYLAAMQVKGADVVAAYAAQLAYNESLKSRVPKSTGDVKASPVSAERDYFTSEEVDRLPKSAYDDPKIMAKIARSMTKW